MLVIKKRIFKDLFVVLSAAGLSGAKKGRRGEGGGRRPTMALVGTRDRKQEPYTLLTPQLHNHMAKSFTVIKEFFSSPRRRIGPKSSRPPEPPPPPPPPYAFRGTDLGG